jgi:hypothetical protein
MNGGKQRAPSGTRLTIEKGATAPSEEERDAVERRESRLAELIDRLGGKGRAKVYRIIDGIPDPQYACSWSVDADLSDNLEERLAELGGGKYAVKLYWGGKCEASLNFSVDAQTHPVKKTEAEQRREGGGMLPQTPAELAAFVSNSLGAALQPLMLAMQQPRSSGSEDLIKLMLLNAQQQAAESRAMTERLLDGMFSQRNAPAPTNGLRELADTVSIVDAIRGDAGGSRDPARDERRSLATKLLEGPVEKAAVRMADRLIDKMTTEENQPAKRRPAPVAQTAPAAAAGPPVAPPARPAQLPTPSPLTPVSMPQGVKPLAQADLARMHGKPAAPTPAPRAAEAVPTAVQKG